MARPTARLRAYFAAPLFNEMERGFNLSVATLLEQYIDVFLPQRDGGLLMQHVRSGVSPDRAAKLVFEADISAMQSSDFLIAILDGSTIDEGVAFETGYMFANGKICVALQTDMRRSLPVGNNPMISSSMHIACHSVDELIDWVKQYGEESRNLTKPFVFSDQSKRLLD